MTRKGSSQRPWTTDEVEALRSMAGRVTRREICRQLKRSRKSVEHAAARLGLSLRCYVSKLVWCDECAIWRSRIDKDGRCRVCAMRERLAGREAACAEALAAMTPEQRAVYDENEAKRGTRRFPARPKPRIAGSCPISRYERERAKAAYLLDIEEWEHRRLKLPYDAAKTRLRRMREVTGTNPRKSLKQ